jgi:hypothetical protein
MASIDKFLDRLPHPGYNCRDFVREVWLELYGEDIASRLESTSLGSGLANFKRLALPVSPCFVFMCRARCGPHVGIYLNRRILHMHDSGTEFQPIEVARRYFTEIRYYR